MIQVGLDIGFVLTEFRLFRVEILHVKPPN